jgi:hypothetical protein
LAPQLIWKPAWYDCQSGHIAVWEQRELFTKEMRAAFKSLR